MQKRKIVKAVVFVLVVWVGFIMTRKTVLVDKSEEIDVLARTIWGEARGEGVTGMQAVANVIINRVNAGIWYGRTVSEVCKKKYQFSCWLPSDPNYAKCQAVTIADNSFQNAMFLAAKGVAGELEDITGGANHYHASSIKPSWADATKVTAQIGNHIFYRL